MLASPLGGYLGDRMPRKYLVAGGVLLWSLATGASGLAATFTTLLVARAFIGIGEAGYGAVAPSIISDLYPRTQRTRMLAFFYIAIPVGAAAGYGAGRVSEQHLLLARGLLRGRRAGADPGGAGLLHARAPARGDGWAERADEDALQGGAQGADGQHGLLGHDGGLHADDVLDGRAGVLDAHVHGEDARDGGGQGGLPLRRA